MDLYKNKRSSAVIPMKETRTETTKKVMSIFITELLDTKFNIYVKIIIIIAIINGFM